MGRPKAKDLPDLSDLAIPGAEILVRATPRARSNGIVRNEGEVRVSVTAVPENGNANMAIRDLLARAMNVPQTRLSLIRGATARAKTFRYDDV